MSTIRPLATIALLAVLGVFLAYKINEGPIVAVDDQWAGAAGEGAEEAPAWGEARPVAPSATDAPTIETPTIEAPPAGRVPSLPTPPSPPTPAASAPPQVPSASREPLALPNSFPRAGSAEGAVVPPSGISGRVPSLGTSVGGVSTPPVASIPPVAPQPSSPPGFDVAWEAIQAALAQGQLSRAHSMLSQWRGEEGLTLMQEQEIDQLLGQLAGSVIYSTEHTLAPAHPVAPGETLATIAQQYNVPWQLLAKINGVATAEAVQPGQTIKVVRGPFAAEVDLQRGELVLMLDDRYAGKFPVRVEGAVPGAGEWRVGQKKLEPAGQNPLGGFATAGATMQQSVVLESPAGERVELSAGANPTPASGSRGRLTVASNDLADLYDILSVGSAVRIFR